jgi:hypothetical protein
MTWLMLTILLNFGVYTEGGVDFKESQLISGNLRFEIPIEVYFTVIEHIIVGGKATSLFGLSDISESVLPNFVPTGIMYYFYAGILINKNIKIMIEHLCEHPIIGDGSIYNGTYNLLQAGYTKFYIEFKGDIIIF